MKHIQLVVGLSFLVLACLLQYNELIRVLFQIIFQLFVLKEKITPSENYPNWSPQARAFNNLIRAPEETPDLKDLRASFEAAKYFQHDMPDVLITQEYSSCNTSKYKVPFLRIRSTFWEANYSLSLLYFHGGGLSIGSANAETSPASFLANELQAQVFSVDYRLLPENTIANSVDDAVSVYKYMLGEGIKPSKILFYGCSSGGLMSLLTAQAIKKLGLPLPKGVVPSSISYGFQFLEGYDKHAEQNQQNNIPVSLLGVLNPKLLLFFNNLIESDSSNLITLQDLLADFKGLPPIYLTVSELDLLKYGNELVAKQLQQSNVSVTFEVWPNMFHCHGHLYKLIPESYWAFKNITSWMSKTNK